MNSPSVSRSAASSSAGVLKWSILVTTMNEEAAIEECLRRIVAVLPADGEVLVIDGGSDRTGEIVRQLEAELPAVRYIRNEHDRGKGHAVQVGMRAASGDAFLQIDADLQFLPEEMHLLMAPIEAGQADLVLGSRFADGSTRRPGSTTPLRTFGNWFTSHYTSLLFGQRMTDVLAGMKAWRREVSERIPLRCENVSYDAELPARAAMAGFRILDVPITTDRRHGGVSAVHVVRDGLRIVRDLTLFRIGLK